MPELVEGGVEIEVDPCLDRLDQPRVAEHAAHVDEEIRVPGEVDEPLVGDADRLVGSRNQKGGAVAEVEGIDNVAEVGDGLRLRRLHGLDENDLVAQPREAEHVLEHRPGRPAVSGHARDHARDENPHANASSRSFAITVSESKYCTAISRAARACRS